MSPRFVMQCNALPMHATMSVHGHSDGITYHLSLVQLHNIYSVCSYYKARKG